MSFSQIPILLMMFSSLSYASLGEWSDYSCLHDVVKSFKALPKKGKTSSFGVKNIFKNKYEYRNVLLNKLGLDNHFQGVTYFRDQDIAVISGGNANTKSGVLLVSKGFSLDNPKINERINVQGEKDLWHAGAISRLDHYLLVPIERFVPTKKSEIQFFDFKNMHSPKKTPFSIKIADDKTGAVDAVYNKKDKKISLFAFDTKSYSIYESNSTKLEDGFTLKNKIKSKIFTGSNMRVLQQCDGELFFADITNDGLVPPFLNGKNVIKLYQFEPKKMSTKQIAKKKFDCDGHCNFRGAASLVSEHNQLHIIATKMYREKKKDAIKFALFSE